MALLFQCRFPIDLFYLLALGREQERKKCREDCLERRVTTEVNVAKAITILCRTGGYRGPFYIFIS